MTALSSFDVAAILSGHQPGIEPFAAVSRVFQESLYALRTLKPMNGVLYRIRRRRILRGWARGRLDYSDAWRQLQRLTRG